MRQSLAVTAFAALFLTILSSPTEAVGNGKVKVCHNLQLADVFYDDCGTCNGPNGIKETITNSCEYVCMKPCALYAGHVVEVSPNALRGHARHVPAECIVNSEVGPGEDCECIDCGDCMLVCLEEE